ncbi:TIGR01440 family protein [Vagococcus sp.]|uniref:TIGR01440 family protein n=1 Tax=Vagococcus sp. TaxID=1933889 RepID=UPI002FC5BC4A
MLDLEKLKKELLIIVEDILEKSSIEKDDIFVVGCSSSEIVGGIIGKNSNEEVGKIVAETLIDFFKEKEINLAFQGCEHINRALTVERSLAKTHGLSRVSVVPKFHAGGATATAAYQLMKDPVVVEYIIADGGIDIGDTSIGMHVRHVQVPIRPSIKTLGNAHVTALGHRPKLIGGARAEYK